MKPIQLKLPTIFEGMTVNAWLFLEPEPTLIDCGEKTDKLWEALVEGLKDNGLTVRDLKKVIITHAHLDHMGMAKRITEESDATIWVNEYTYPWAVDLKTMLDRRTEAIVGVMKDHLPEKHLEKYFGFGYEMLAPYWDEIPADRVAVFPMEGPIEFGGTTWEIIYAPGHCINQTCFFQRESGHFLSADMLLKIIPNPIIDAGIEAPFTREKSLLVQLDSYKKIAQLPIKVAFPGHFEAIYNAPELIEKQVDKIWQRTEKCFQLIESGVQQTLPLVDKIYPNRVNNATVFMTIGFLDILQDAGRIKSFRDTNGLLSYVIC
ncbi:MAG: MBL fold metallo-hydrolase [Bacteroidota bacterium]